jgi:hypothetical protein
MSIYLQVDDIIGVLLADGWHVVSDASFYLDAYEFVTGSEGAADDDDDPELLYNGESQGCSTGFEFVDPVGDRIAGPLTSILAVRRAPQK